MSRARRASAQVLVDEREGRARSEDAQPPLDLGPAVERMDLGRLVHDGLTHEERAASQFQSGPCSEREGEREKSSRRTLAMTPSTLYPVMTRPFRGSGAHFSRSSRLTPLVRKPGDAMTTHGLRSLSFEMPRSSGRMNESCLLKSKGLMPRANLARTLGDMVWMYLRAGEGGREGEGAASGSRSRRREPR